MISFLVHLFIAQLFFLSLRSIQPGVLLMPYKIAPHGALRIQVDARIHRSIKLFFESEPLGTYQAFGRLIHYILSAGF